MNFARAGSLCSKAIRRGLACKNFRFLRRPRDAAAQIQGHIGSRDPDPQSRPGQSHNRRAVNRKRQGGNAGSRVKAAGREGGRLRKLCGDYGENRRKNSAPYANRRQHPHSNSPHKKNNFVTVFNYITVLLKIRCAQGADPISSPALPLPAHHLPAIVNRLRTGKKVEWNSQMSLTVYLSV